VLYSEGMFGAKTNKRLIILLLLCSLTALSFREWRVRPDGDVSVHMLDIGQGDSIFITGPSGQQILIDGGPDLSALQGIGKRMSFFDRTIDLLILSHPHRDHLFAFPAILKRYNVKAVLFTGVDYPQPQYEEFVNTLRREHIPVIIADPSKDIDMGDGLFLDVLWPLPIYVGNPDPSGGNDSSVVVKLIYGEDSILFTGDMEKPEEDEVLASGADLSADILKAAHHGSKTSSSTGFLLAVDPQLILISVGKENPFNHPSPEIVERFEHFGIPYRSTAQEGTITIDLDGQ
jgi:competence protein ComEC